MNLKSFDPSWNEKNCNCIKNETEDVLCNYCISVVDKHHYEFFVGDFSAMKSVVKNILLRAENSNRFKSQPNEESLMKFSAAYYAENVHVFCSIFFFVAIGLGEGLEPHHRLGVTIIENVFSEQLGNFRVKLNEIAQNGLKCGIQANDTEITNYLARYYERAFKTIFPGKALLN